MLNKQPKTRGTDRPEAGAWKGGGCASGEDRPHHVIPSHVEASPGPKTIGEKSTPIHPSTQPDESILLFSLVPTERSGAAAQGPAVGRIMVDNSQVHREVPLPVARLQQHVLWDSAISGDVHLAGMRDPSFGNEKGLTGLTNRRNEDLKN